MSFFSELARHMSTQNTLITDINLLIHSTRCYIEEHFFFKIQLPKERFQTFMPMRACNKENKSNNTI